MLDIFQVSPEMSDRVRSGLVSLKHRVVFAPFSFASILIRLPVSAGEGHLPLPDAATTLLR